jgi:uncharacterized repeat protein (TIGR02543 family)
VDTPTGGTVTGAGTYDSGTTATLTATADSGYTFSSWGGDASGTNNPLSLTVSSDLNVSATFSAIPTTPTYVVSVSLPEIFPLGGSVTGAGTYDSGATATLTASPDSGYSFEGWGGDANGTTNPLSLTVNQDFTVTASFSATTLWSAATTVGGGWYDLTNTFGYYYSVNSVAWIYHYGLGWLYPDPASESSDSTWLYLDGRGWMYMKTTDFPHMWDDYTGDWVYYDEYNGQPSLYEYKNDTWVALDNLE